MAKAIALTQTGFNGQPMFASQVALNTSLIYNLEDGLNIKVFYKNADGTVLNIVETTDTIGDILTGVNAVTPDVRMFSVYDTNFNLILIPTASFMMASELNDGGSIITYINNSSIANARVNNSVASLVNIINGVTAGQYDSGQITIDTTTAPNSNYFVSAIDNTFKSTMISYNSQNTYDSLNRPNIFYGVYNSVWFRPTLPWAGITKVTVYTNATAAGTTPFNFAVSYGYSKEYYVPGTTTEIIDYQAGSGNLGNPVFNAVNLLVAGTPPANPNAGDAGTYYGEVTYASYPGSNAGPWASGFVGNNFISTGVFSIPTPTLADYWECAMMSFQFQTKISDPNFKFRIVIDYI
jgi:hypothetical protein